MDKYQSYIMKNYKPSLYGKCFSPQGDIHSFKVVFDASYTITLCQHENITFSNYSLYIECKSTIVECVCGVRGTEQVVSRLGERQVRAGWQTTVLPIDFSVPFDSLRIVFKDNLVDDIIIPIIYQAADKDAYYARIEQERAAELLKNANIKVSTGADLVNIYFQPCTSTYSKAVIELYTATGKFEQEHISGPMPIFDGMAFAPPKLLGGTINIMIGQFEVDHGVFFKSITGLAHGVYAIKLIQFDEGNNELLKSDELFFVIR